MAHSGSDFPELPTASGLAKQLRKGASAIREAVENKQEGIVDTAKTVVSSAGNKVKTIFSPKNKKIEKSPSVLIESDPFLSEYKKLLKKWDAINKNQAPAQAWMLQELMSGFMAARTYPLSAEEKNMLVEDMRAANRLVAALHEFTLAKDAGSVNDAIKNKLIAAQVAAFDLAERNITSKRPALSMAGAALGTAAITAGIIVLLTVSAPVMPFIVAGCFIGGIALLAFTAINQYRLTHCSFYGQNEKNHAKMHEAAQIAAEEVEALDKQPGCFGR